MYNVLYNICNKNTFSQVSRLFETQWTSGLKYISNLYSLVYNFDVEWPVWELRIGLKYLGLLVHFKNMRPY